MGALPTGSLSKAKATALQAVLEGMVRSGAPDAIAAVITEDGTWAGAAGIAGAKGRKATPEDEFAIASITKTFTAALVMRLVEQGKMNLDEPLASYMGDLKVDTNGATVRQALEMRAGLADYPQPAAADHIRADAAHVWTAKEMVAEMDAPVAAAGKTYLYSSAAYELLARAIEHVTGTSYASALREELLDPWHLDRVIGQGPERATPKPWAFRSTGTSAPGRPRTSGSAARSSASRRRRMGPGRARSPATLRLSRPGPGTCSPATSCPLRRSDAWLRTGDGFAYGLEAAPYGSRSVGASGGKTGYGAQFTMFPEAHAVIVIFVNDPDFIVEPTVSALLEAATPS